MLLASFLLCCLVSFLTGTSFGSAATIGVICMTMADSMGIPSIYTGGAILAGIFFGDRCSPVSTSALLVSELTKTDLFSNIRNMLRSALVPFALSCIIYAVLGWTLHAGTSADSTRNLLQNYYHFTPLMLLPVVLVLVLSLLRIDIKKTIAISVLMGMVLAVTVQHFSISELPALCFSGFSPADKNIAALMGGGGFLSMARVYVIVGISSCYSGMFEGPVFSVGSKL